MATKDFSDKQEHMIADFLGWRVVSGSGARPCHPGDIISDEWLGECKTHEESGKPIYFSSSVWNKICDEAIANHRLPILFTDDGSQTLNKTWCIINEFTADPSWKRVPFPKKFRTNIRIKHEDLASLYNVTDILNSVAEPLCYIAELSESKVAVLPLRLFRYMFQ